MLIELIENKNLIPTGYLLKAARHNSWYRIEIKSMQSCSRYNNRLSCQFEKLCIGFTISGKCIGGCSGTRTLCVPRSDSDRWKKEEK
jgi:hypothetical protein